MDRRDNMCIWLGHWEERIPMNKKKFTIINMHGVAFDIWWSTDNDKLFFLSMSDVIKLKWILENS